MNVQCHVSDLSNLPVYLPGAVVKRKVPPMEDLQLKSRLFCVTRGHPLLAPLLSNFFFLFPSTLVRDSRQKSLAKVRVSAPAQAKDGSKEGTERGIVPTLQSGKSRSGKKMQV